MKSTGVVTVVATLVSIVSAKTCKNITVPVTISARNGKFNKAQTPISNIEVNNFILDLSQQGGNLTEKVLEGVSFRRHCSQFKLPLTCVLLLVCHRLWHLQACHNLLCSG